MSNKLPAALTSALERMEFQVARALIRLASRVERYLPERAAHVVDGNRLNMEIRVLLGLQSLVAPMDIHKLGPAAARLRVRRDARVHAGPRVPVGSVRDLTLDTHVPLKARLYGPSNPGGPRPLLVFFHGGGFVVGDLDTHDLPCRLLCKHAGVHVLSIDYRLAPEHPFPAAVDDAVAAYDWACAHASRLGADASRVGVAGDSAGANLAAVVSLLAAKAKKPLPALQLLFYPTVDRSVDRPSLGMFAAGYFLTRAHLDWYTRQYVPNESDLTDPRVSPLLEKELAGQPPALVVTAGFDPLRDEGNAYAQVLQAAGNTVELMVLSELVHGFINLGALSPHARTRLIEIADKARKMLVGDSKVQAKHPKIDAMEAAQAPLLEGPRS